MRNIISFVLPISVLVGLIISIIAIWVKIFTKAGFKRWMGFLMVIPIANIVMLLILAFKEWPVEQKIRQLEKEKYREN